MKKIFVLLLSFSVAAVAMAQSKKIEEARRVIRGGEPETRRTEDGRSIILGGEDRRVYGDNSSREARIDQVNREYDARIYDVRNNRNLSSAEKERRIRELRNERNRRIREINEEYRRNENRRYDDRDYDDRRYDDDDDYKKDKKNKKYKGNNGKHKGWEKGKGNPHRGRG